MSASQFHRNVFLIAAVVYLITAWNSTGYHSADEHFQIIAFAQWKLGELPVEHLPWEFDAGIRSSLQPWIAVVVFKCAAHFGVQDPFVRTFLLRALTALLALFAMRGFVRFASKDLGTRQQQAITVLAYGLWFIPFLAVRSSSEGWSGIFLLFAVTSVLGSGGSSRWVWRTGIFAGLAMLCRPPTGLIVLSLIAWLAVVRRSELKALLQLGSAALLVLLVGLLLDHLFYGRFTPTTWNYVSLGFFGDPGHRFDELPWYYYPPWIVKYAIPPIGAVILLTFVVLLVKRPKHLLVWCILPYVIVHSLIAHKELRFLYPLACLVPWMLMEAWRSVPSTWIPIRATLHWMTAGLLIVTNTVGLLVVMSSPAGEGRVRLAEALHEHAQPGDRIAYVVEPDIAWRITLPAFYAPVGTEEVVIDPMTPAMDTANMDFIVLQDDAPVPVMTEGTILTELARTETKWVKALLFWYTWGEGRQPWTVYRVEH